MAKDDFEDIKVTPELVERVSTLFSDLMRDGFQEPQRIAMDWQNAFAYEPGICATHDYCDANMDMLASVEDALVEAGNSRKRANAFATCCDDDATEAAQERRGELWNGAWAKARDAGYSYLKGQVSLEDLRTLGPCLMEHPEREEHAARYPDHVETAFSELDHAAQDLTDAIEREEVTREHLASMAEAVRAKDDTKLAGLLDEALGTERNVVNRW